MIAKVLGYQGIPTNTLYVVPQMLPCPTCDGGFYGNPDMPGYVTRCPSCGGSDRVAPPWPTHIATEQQRISIGMDWSDWQEPFTDDGTVIALGEISHSERRQVVAYKVTATEQLAVTDDADGQVVWRLHLEALEQPYTEMAVKRYRPHVPWSVDQQYRRVPLSVPVGEVIDVELAP